MKNILSMMILVALALFVVGCSEQQNTGGRAFIGGTEGLRTTFLPGNPPDAVFDGGQSTFSIVIKLENIGEDTFAANDGYIMINGLDPGTYGATSFKKNIDSEIRGAVKNFDGSVLNGGVATVEFGNLRYGPTIQGNIEQTVWADICYKYTSKSTAQLCIKRDPQLLIGDDKICDVEGEKGPQNSGSPIHLTSLKENFAGNGKIGVTMVLTHVGNGDHFFDDRAAECNDVESNPDRGRVHVTVRPVTIGGRSITPQCTGFSETRGNNEGYVRLYKDGSGQETFSLYCTIDATTADSIFEVPLDVEVTYKYLQHVEKITVVRHVYQ